MRIVIVILASVLNLSSVVAGKIVTSSNAEIVSGFAMPHAKNSSYLLRVNQLATNEVWVTKFEGVDHSVTSKPANLVISVRGVKNIFYISAGTTLRQLADQVNMAKIGATATVYELGNGETRPARLAITDDQPGKFDGTQNLSFRSTLTNLLSESFTPSAAVSSKDAEIHFVEGRGIMHRSTNIISDVIPGLILVLNQADPDTIVTLTVSD